ncbi:FAD-dependent monooxygenase [Flammeovirga aprica]|uniref:NAD(P)-binding protein n=1 Tax=Flammeovirga aprica JL-4 TaxID=694437 RepID=A0A7X9RT53_9BACT|nr:FAD-dependent monooxygenase [Flammeovirga aprica]NME67936.1 NAD(P)-binding protein [Flammeovirga aprica JL-4]
MKIDIIGAGIGGLTTAIALKQKGFTARVFEQAKEIKPVGAGIILANNAMQVYEKLGLKDFIEQNGNPISSMNITKANLQQISEIDLTFFEKKYQVKNIAIHRGALQQILMEQLTTEELYLDHQLHKIESNQEEVLLQFENGHQEQSPLVIGADGLRSNVRQQLFDKTTIRHAHQICWRGVTDFDLPDHYKNELNEAWGKTDRFGFLQIAENKVYWYALKSFSDHKEEFRGEKIEKFFTEYHPIVNEIITSTSQNQINTAEISDLKPTRQWFHQNVCLMGDAAHATTPNMGQGACQAVEDANVLAECLSKYKSQQAFQVFQKLRMPKAHQVVKTSWRVGKVAHLSNPILRWCRNQLMQFTPSSFNQEQYKQLFKISNI